MEVSEEILKKLFETANMPYSKDVSEADMLKLAVKLESIKNESKESIIQKAAIEPLNSNNILVVDDIGVVTYQLKVLLQNLGFNVQVAKDIFNGLNYFLKSNFAFIIMDLFVSTEQEGFTLLNETKKIIEKNNLSTKIIVITASAKTENKVKCLNSGADIFLKKEIGWQDRLVEIIQEYKQNA